MAAPRRIPEGLIRFARQIADRKRALRQQLATLPTNGQVAMQIGCSERYLQRVLAGRRRNGHSA